MKKRKIVEPSKVPWSIEYMGKQGTVIHDADGRLALVCPVHNAELIVNAVNAYNNLRDENARLFDDNYQLRNELRIAKKKEEDVKYEYAIQEKRKGDWILVEKGFSSLFDVKEYIKVMCSMSPNMEFRIVRRQADWKVVE